MNGYNQKEVKQAQQIMLELLESFDGICRRHGLRYWICAGTLLGAVRHKGYIPWDDDTDVAMPREDLKRFLSIAPTELPPDQFLQTSETDPAYNYLPLPCKLRNRNNFLIEREGAPYHQGIFMDIVPADNYSSSRWGYLFERGMKAYARRLIYLYDSIDYAEQNFLRGFFSRQHPMIRKWLKAYLRYARHRADRNNRNTAPTRIGFGLDISWEGWYDYEVIFPLQEMAFEGVKLYAPNNAHAVLEQRYGDYMKLPPEEERGSHALRFEFTSDL